MPDGGARRLASPGRELGRPRIIWLLRLWRWFYRRVVQRVPWLKLFRFGVSVLVAGTLWYFLKLSREYSIDISYPLLVSSPPAGYLLSGQSAESVRMRVRGNGYTLVRYRTMRSYSPLYVDLQSLSLAVGADDSVSHHCVSRAELERILSPQIPTDLTLEHFATEQVCFDLSRLDRRKLPVVASVRYTLHEQYAQYQPIELSQDSVVVVGPAAELDTMRYAYADTVYLGRLSSSQRVKLKLSPRGKVQFIPSELVCSIPVVQFTRKRMTIPIRVEGAVRPDHVALLPRTVELTCDVPLSAYMRIKPEDFAVRVRFFEGITPERVLVELVDAPGDAHNVSFGPQYVSYLITR